MGRYDPPSLHTYRSSRAFQPLPVLEQFYHKTRPIRLPIEDHTAIEVVGIRRLVQADEEGHSVLVDKTPTSPLLVSL